MTEDKVKEFLDGLSACIEERDLDACVSVAAEQAKKMGISPQRLLELSDKKHVDGQFKLEHVLALAAAQDLDEKAPAFKNAGRASYKLKAYEKAEELYKKAINSDKNFAPAYYNLGVLFYELDRKTEAEEQYRLAIKADPNLAPAYYNLGILLYELDRKTEAEEQYRLAIKANSNLALAYYNLGILLYELGRKTEAEEQYRLAIKANPNDASAYNNLGYLLDDLGRKTEAEEQYRLAIKADPNDVVAHNNYADLLREIGKFSEAEKEVRIALDIDPSEPSSLGTYGDILADEGWLDEAEKTYKSALKPSDKAKDALKSKIHNNLGWVYTQKKRYDHARYEFSEACRLDPKNVKAIRNLRALSKINQPSEITREQICITGLLLLPLAFTTYIFWIEKLKETTFSALLIFFIAAMLFVLLYRSIGKFSVGPQGVNFEMSTGHLQSIDKSQMADDVSSRIERS